MIELLRKVFTLWTMYIYIYIYMHSTFITGILFLLKQISFSLHRYQHPPPTHLSLYTYTLLFVAYSVSVSLSFSLSIYPLPRTTTTNTPNKHNISPKNQRGIYRRPTGGKVMFASTRALPIRDGERARATTTTQQFSDI